MIRAYHFTGSALRDGRPLPPRGVWLSHEGPLRPCFAGLHASVHPFDALTYAPGALLHQVELEGEMLEHGTPPDKWCARQRRIIATRDSTRMLRAFARWCAAQVLSCWKHPAAVRTYILTGDETLRFAARAAAESAAWAAALAATEPLAWDAAHMAALAAAEIAAWGTAWATMEPMDLSDAVKNFPGWDTTKTAARAAQRDRFFHEVEALFTESMDKHQGVLL